MIHEITLFLPNKSGQLGQALQALDEGKVNIQAFSIEAAGEFSTVRLICSDEKLAAKQFQKYAYSFSTKKVFAIILSHSPGELLGIAELFGSNKINIEYGYQTLLPQSKQAIVIISVKNEMVEKAKKLLVDNSYKDQDNILDC